MVLLVLFPIFFLCFRQMWLPFGEVFSGGNLCYFHEVTEVSGPPMMPPPFGYQPMQLPQVWDVQMGVSNGSEFFFSVAWVGWGVGTWVGLRLRYSYYSWDFYFLCFFSWMNVDSSSCHGSGHDFMVRSLLLYFFAKQLHSTSSPERLKHLCKKAPTSKETNKTSNKKRQKPSCKVPSDHAQDPSVTDVFHRGNAILGTGSHHAIGCHALGCWEEVLGVQRLIFFWRSVGRSKQGGWNWLASRQLSTPRLLPAALLFAPWARCLL